MAQQNHNNRVETWSTRVGVILAVTGSAVGLGNFLRFPGVAAEYGGTFMVPYLICFLIVGLPVALVEWTIGRYGGRHGFNSVPGVFRSIAGRSRIPYIGVLGLLLPVLIYTYYIYVVGWCLAYACFYATGSMTESAVGGDYEGFFETFVGAQMDGAAYLNPLQSPLIFVVIAFVLNFALIYRGLSKGIERFCQLAMPTLVICAVIVLIRVLTLGTPNPEQPEQNLANGLGYMWNPATEARSLTPGDKALSKLVRRSSANAATVQMQDGRVEALEIENWPAFRWALTETGWKPAGQKAATDEDETDGAEQQPAPSGEWIHEKADVSLLIENKLARFEGPKVKQIRHADQVDGEAEVAVNDPGSPVQQLLALLPRDVAEKPSKTKFTRINVTDREGFQEALSATGWSAPADEKGGSWTNPDSRLHIEVKNEAALISMPGFWAMLANPQLWLEAAGQIFFSLSVGFGIICTYASYMKPDDDVALSSVTAAAGNGFAEVVLAGLTIVPAGFIFLGPSFVANPPGTFGMGFSALPGVFNQMPAGQFFGFLFFALLFLAAMTSTLSMLQPAIAFLEEGLGVGRKTSVALLGFITAPAAAFVMYFSKGHTALTTIDFWMANVGIFILATTMVILFGWKLGIGEGRSELERGAEIRIPRFVGHIIKYVSPVFLVVIFIAWIYSKIGQQVNKIFNNLTVALSAGLVVLVLVLFLLLIAQAKRRWDAVEDL